MARANQRSNDAPRDAIALLKEDHRNVEQLFEQFEAADDAELSTIATRICEMLTVHAQIEEEILYPAAKQAFEEEESEEELDLVNEAAVEHASAKDLIAKIEAMTPEHEAFRATVKVLGEYIQHHVKEEETELFPELKKTELDLKELGGQLLERKMALMEELGIEEQPTEAPKSRSRTGRSGSRSTATRGGARRSGSKSSGRSARH
jgi:hemerythrin-like domain-containing protein